ncbi:MAG: UDP-3-O-(3-hydroxymyristoyl)glucosamine N-acyltransferase [Euryarchaeota archaeon]|nr:UDP-3-O-(3-hydroxymyristoyl)glucosamine N-acyltransferase [Euryarchaeota archaeon]
MDTLKQWKTYKIGEVLKTLNIQNYSIAGASEMTFSAPSALWEGKKESIAFCSIKKIRDPIATINASQASVVLAQKEIDNKKLNLKNKTIVLVESPRLVFIKILNKCFPPEKKAGGIHPSSEIHPDADIHPSVYIGPHCVIGKCKIQEHTIIYPNVIINDNVIIGKQVIISPGCIIGYDGFGYSRNEDGSIEKFPHYRGVIIEDDVELGSNVSVDRGTLSDTIIKKGAKIDNFCHIAHNVVIGKYALVIAHAMVGGSTEIGDYAWIAPSAALREGIKIGEKAFVGLGAVVTKDVPDNTVVVGNPAIPLEQFKKIQNFLKTIPIKKE